MIAAGDKVLQLISNEELQDFHDILPRRLEASVQYEWPMPILAPEHEPLPPVEPDFHTVKKGPPKSSNGLL